MRYLVSNQRVVVHMLLFISNHTAIAGTLSTLTRERQVEFVSCNAVMQRDHIMIHTTIRLLVDIDIAYAYILIMGLFQTIEVE